VSVDATRTQLLDALVALDRDAVLSQFEKVTRERDEYKKLATPLQEANEKLKRGLVGQSAERLPPDDAQLSLAILRLALGLKDDEAETKPPPDEEQTIPEHTRRKPVRKPIPDPFPRVTIELIPDEVKREGLDAFERIGEDAREVIERRPASTVAVRLVYPKFVRKGRVEGAPTPVLVAEPAELPIPRGTAGPAMLADTLVRRWADHQPLNRLEGIYAREGLELAKSTLSTWHDQLRELAEPIVDAMFTDAKSAPYLCVDATSVLVQAPERCKHGHFWVMVAPGKHVLYKFSHRHNRDAVDALLAGYAGYLVADAHAVYDHLYATGDVVEVGYRVGGDVAAPAPHRPGRADFPHPVLHVTGSLADYVLSLHRFPPNMDEAEKVERRRLRGGVSPVGPLKSEIDMRVFSGCNARPNRLTRLPSTSRTRRQSRRSSNAMTKPSAKRTSACFLFMRLPTSFANHSSST
jgi:transposase